MNNIIFIISILVLLCIVLLFFYKKDYDDDLQFHRYILVVDVPNYKNKFKRSRAIMINVSSSVKYDEDGLKELKESVATKLGLINKEDIRIIYKGFE